MDVAYMDKIAKHNNGVKYLLVAVDVFSRYLRVQPLKTMYALIALKPSKNDQDETTRESVDGQRY